MAQLYDGADFTLTIDGLQLNCVSRVGISENMDFLPGVRELQGFTTSRDNLQSYQLDVDGTDDGAYSYLYPYYSGRTYFNFTYGSNDGEIVDKGIGFIKEITRSSDENGDQTFAATIIAFGVVENTTELSFLLLEDGDYILLEDASRIKN